MTTPNTSTPGIDPRSPRFGAAITTVLLAATIVLTLIPATWTAGIVLLAVIVVLFAIGGIAGIRRHPYGAIFRRFVRPRLAPPAELEAPEPPTFAQQVGLVITALALVLALVGVPAAAPVGAAIALVAAFLNAVFDVCIGCLLYVWLVRAGVFRPRRGVA
jgi:cytochrome c biogenesis protein CcdA